jgi:hypothetical protein
LAVNERLALEWLTESAWSNDAMVDEHSVRRQYHKRALQLHPDRPGGDAEAFRQLHELYQTLAKVF